MGPIDNIFLIGFTPRALKNNSPNLIHEIPPVTISKTEPLNPTHQDITFKFHRIQPFTANASYISNINHILIQKKKKKPHLEKCR